MEWNEIPERGDNIKALIHQEQLRLLYGNLKAALPGNLLVCFALNGVYWELVSQTYIVVWALSLKALLLSRYLDYRQFRRIRGGHFNARRWEWRFILGAALTGLMWGILFTLFLMPGKPEYVLFILCVYTILITIANATNAARVSAFLAFLFPVSLPLIASLLGVGDTLYTIMGVVFGIFVAANILICHLYSRNIREAIRLRFENTELIGRLEVEKQRAEKAVLDKDRFLAAASHDLRQPLHAQGLYLDVLEPNLKEAGKPQIKALRKTNQALANLLNSLLDISCLNAGAVDINPGYVRLYGILFPIYADYLAEAQGKGLKLEIDCPLALVVLVDTTQLERIVRNLLSNAIRYTRQGHVRLRGEAAGNDVVTLSVCDTGVGIPVSEHEKIFQEYYQLHNPERDRDKGLGLGLATVKKLCLLMNLKLDWESEVGKGSCFRIGLPAGSEQHLTPVVAKLPSPFCEEKIHLLVIDDDHEILEGMRQLLAQWECHVTTAESAADALRQLRPDAPLDCIMADYRLCGGKTGIEAIQHVREFMRRDIPAMMITGNTSEALLQQARKTGFFLLSKPVAPGKLRSALNLCLKNT